MKYLQVYIRISGRMIIILKLIKQDVDNLRYISEKSTG